MSAYNVPGFFTTDNSNLPTYPGTPNEIWTRPRDLRQFQYLDVTDDLLPSIHSNESYPGYDEATGRVFEWIPIDHIKLESQGNQGPQGMMGFRGSKGGEGDRGLQGATGLPGEMGLKGPDGDDGDPGPTGFKGPMGYTKCNEIDYPDKYFIEERGKIFITNGSNKIIIATGL